MKLTLTLDLEPQEMRRISQSSIERCINSSMELATHSLNDPDDRISELASIDLDNWEDVKLITVHIWQAIQNAIFTARLEEIKR